MPNECHVQAWLDHVNPNLLTCAANKKRCDSRHRDLKSASSEACGYTDPVGLGDTHVDVSPWCPTGNALKCGCAVRAKRNEAWVLVCDAQHGLSRGHPHRRAGLRWPSHS